MPARQKYVKTLSTMNSPTMRKKLLHELIRLRNSRRIPMPMSTFIRYCEQQYYQAKNQTEKYQREYVEIAENPIEKRNSRWWVTVKLIQPETRLEINWFGRRKTDCRGRHDPDPIPGNND